MQTSLPPEVQFLKESDKLKGVLRQTLIHDGSRRENSAEHSWQLVLAVVSCQNLANESIDLARAMKMALIHDLVEIDAGDTFVYDTKANENKFEKELQAASRIFGLLPPRQEEFRELWLAYEKCECPESRYVAALDRFLPVFSNCVTGGHAWRVNRVKAHQVLARNAAIEKGSKKLWEVARAMIQECIDQGQLEV